MEDLEKNSLNRFKKWSGSYDSNFFNHTFFSLTNKAVIKLLHLKENQSILDVGCGTGIFLEHLLLTNQSLKLHGLDLTPEMLNIAKQKFKDKPDVELTLGSATNMPYKDNSFDYVICCHSFHHHPDSKQSLLEMSRVVKPGGQVLILDFSLDGIFRKILFTFGSIIENEGKVYRYTKDQMIQFFKRAELSHIQQTYIYGNLVTMGTKSNI